MNLQDAPWIGNPEYERREPEIVTHCEHCGIAIFEGEEYVEYQDSNFCDKHCVMAYVNNDVTELGDDHVGYEGEIFDREELEEYVEEELYYRIAESDEGEW